MMLLGDVGTGKTHLACSVAQQVIRSFGASARYTMAIEIIRDIKMTFDKKSERTERDVYLLKKISLWEVSVVTFAMNEAAYVTDVKSLLERGETPPPSKVERALREVGFSGSQAKAFMAKGYSAVSPREAGVGEALDSLKSIFDKL